MAWINLRRSFLDPTIAFRFHYICGLHSIFPKKKAKEREDNA